MTFAQAALPAAGACPLIFTTACHLREGSELGIFFGGVRSTAVRMVAQHAVHDALVPVIDHRPGFEQGIVLFTLPLCASATRVAFYPFLPRWGNPWDTGSGE